MSSPHRTHYFVDFLRFLHCLFSPSIHSLFLNSTMSASQLTIKCMNFQQYPINPVQLSKFPQLNWDLQCILSKMELNPLKSALCQKYNFLKQILMIFSPYIIKARYNFFIEGLVKTLLLHQIQKYALVSFQWQRAPSTIVVQFSLFHLHSIVFILPKQQSMEYEVLLSAKILPDSPHSNMTHPLYIANKLIHNF